jgi:hypothetical protein
LTRRLINPYEFYDSIQRVYIINNEDHESHIDIPAIVNIFAYDRINVFEFYEQFLNRTSNVREKLRNYFYSKQLRFENNEWVNIPNIPLSNNFLLQSKLIAEEKYNPPVVNARDIIEQEKNVNIIPKLIKKTTKEQLFRLLDRFPEELKYFTPLEANFFGFSKEESDELIRVYTLKDKKIIKQFRDKILKVEKNKHKVGGSETSLKNSKQMYFLHILPFF